MSHKKTLGFCNYRILAFFLSSTFIYEAILKKKKSLNDTIEKTHIFHKMKYDIKGQLRSHNMTFLFKYWLFLTYILVCLCYWLIEATNAVNIMKEQRQNFTCIKTTLGYYIWRRTLGSLRGHRFRDTLYLQMQIFLKSKYDLRSYRTPLMLWRGCMAFLLSLFDLMTTLTYVLKDNFCPCFQMNSTLLSITIIGRVKYIHIEYRSIQKRSH